jgi:hypothetical protein
MPWIDFSCPRLGTAPEKNLIAQQAEAGHKHRQEFMARYWSMHAVACLTRQQLQSLVEELKRDQTVTAIRFVADSVEGKMLCEFDSPNREILEAFLVIHNMHPQWVMRAEHEWD